MATQKRRRTNKLRFELSRSSIGGIAIVCFCIFLWMFLFGVWAGQSLLKPASPVVPGFQAGTGGSEPRVIQLEETKKIKP